MATPEKNRPRSTLRTHSSDTGPTCAATVKPSPKPTTAATPMGLVVLDSTDRSDTESLTRPAGTMGQAHGSDALQDQAVCRCGRCLCQDCQYPSAMEVSRAPDLGSAILHFGRRALLPGPPSGSRRQR